MESFGTMIQGTLALFQIEFTLFGFTLSFWKVFLFSAAGSILAWMIWRLFIDD